MSFKFTKTDFHLIMKTIRNRLVVSSGMPRSGSTLLFNILREILLTQYREKDISTCWITEIKDQKFTKVYLIKTHFVGRFLNMFGNEKFYTYRDIRTAAVSRKKRFNEEITMKMFDEYIKQYQYAKQIGSLCIRYEDFIANKAEWIEKIANTLKISIDVAEIEHKVDQIKPPKKTSKGHEKSTLLHAGHVTGSNKDDWSEYISEALMAELIEKYQWWFDECGYEY